MKHADTHLNTFLLVALIGLIAIVPLSYGKGSYPNTFNSLYPNSVSDDNASAENSVCNLCHTPNGTDTWNPYGNAIKREMDGGMSLSNAMTAVQDDNSDGDTDPLLPSGWTNLMEITYGGQPGWTTGLNNYYDADGSFLGTLTAPAIIDLDPDPAVDLEPITWGRLKLTF